MDKDLEALMAEEIRKALNRDGYILKAGTDFRVRVNGVAEGELFLAVTCRVFKRDDKNK